MFQIKRAYEPASPDDGERILIDRLWPRGLSKAKAHIDAWMKDLAPSTELRQWFAHDPTKWRDFATRYRAELREHSDELTELARKGARRRVTLVYSAHDSEHNNAVVLQGILSRRGKKRAPQRTAH